MSTLSNCPCEGLVHPVAPLNLPNLSSVAYRVGDFLSFRQALLIARDGEQALSLWRPTAADDLLLQMVEWWAYVADVLTFYNERAINEVFLLTAARSGNVRNLIRLLGYRPRPGIAATATVAALLSEKKSITLPAGFRIQSKPAPGKQPQTFETETSTLVAFPDSIAASPPEELVGADGSILLDGKIDTVKPGDIVLLQPVNWDGDVADSRLRTVASVSDGKDPSNKPYTKLTFTSPLSLAAGVQASAYTLMRSRQQVGMWGYTTSYPLMPSPADLESVIKAIQPGQPAVFTAPGVAGLSNTLVRVTATSEAVWYPNSPSSSNPFAQPSSPAVPIGIPHTRMFYTPSLSGSWESNKSSVRVLIDWQDVGKLRNTPVATFSGTPATLQALGGATFPTGLSLNVLIEDTEGAGVQATASVQTSSLSTMQIASFATPPPAMKTPLKVLTNLLSLSRGQSVNNEILGSGDATLPAQKFVLKKSPVTYYASGDSFRSSLRVYVDGVLWTEAPSFYGQTADARVYVTREDDEEKTTVEFGDGTNGARLPSGSNNVIANYRFGSGAEAPAEGTLTIIGTPFPGLKAIRNPVGAGGGADPDPADRIKQYAPRSVLTFGRAISSDDYVAIAGSTPGVARVQSYFAWNADEQRATVKLYVGDDGAAVTAAQTALKQVSDPNRKFTVLPAIPVLTFLLVLVRVEPDRIASDVATAVKSALGNADTGLMGLNRIRIGQTIYFSEVDEACHSVPGVRSVPFGVFLLVRGSTVTFGFPPRIVPNEGEFFQVPEANVFVYPVVASNG